MTKPLKNRRPPGCATRKARKKPTVKTIHHPEGVSAAVGSEERLRTLRYRSMELRRNGLMIHQVAAKLFEEFELVKLPPVETVHGWINQALNEAMQGNKAACEEAVRIHTNRCEAGIAALARLAFSDFVVERTRTVEGVEYPVIDERVLVEKVKAIGEIRKLGESILKAMGITRPQSETEKMTADGMHTFLINIVTNHIAAPGQKIALDSREKILELSTGDPLIDGM